MSEGNNVRRKKWPIVLFFCGAVALILGIIALVVNLVSKPAISDAEFMISNGEWVREDEPTVIWDFTEAGKGTLTTDGHLNNYDFTWMLDGNKLKIETSWLYDLADEFDYTLDQGAKTLTIKNDEKSIEVKFKLQDRPKREEATTTDTKTSDAEASNTDDKSNVSEE